MALAEALALKTGHVHASTRALAGVGGAVWSCQGGCAARGRERCVRGGGACKVGQGSHGLGIECGARCGYRKAVPASFRFSLVAKLAVIARDR